MEKGIITSVYYSEGVVECDVQPFRGSGIYSEVEYLPANSDLFSVPEQGMYVNLEKDNDNEPFITSIRSNQQEYPDSLKEGELVVQLDSNTKLLVEKKSDSNHKITIEASDSVDIEANGDINLKAGGNIYINGTNFSQHSHPYQDSTISDTGDGSGSESSTKKTTGSPE